MFGHLKVFRCVATRYDRLSHNLHAAICIVALICYWL